MGHCRVHDTLILGVRLNGWGFRHIRLLSKENEPMCCKENES